MPDETPTQASASPPDSSPAPPNPILKILAQVLRAIGQLLQGLAGALDGQSSIRSSRSEPSRRDRPTVAATPPAPPRSDRPPLQLAAEDEGLPPLTNRLEEVWNDIVQLVKSLLPGVLRRVIPDQVISVLLTLVLVVSGFKVVAFILPNSRPPAELTKQPIPPLVEPQPVGEPETTPIPAAPTDPVVPPVAAPAPAATTPPTATPPRPTPQLEQSPDTAVISDIQRQISQATRSFGADLVQSVQVSFWDSRLTVYLNSGWYDLAPSRQANLAAAILKQGRSLEFAKIRLADTEDVTLARSPVVGDDMILVPHPRRPIAAQTTP